MIHERLCESDDLMCIALASYLSDLAAQLVNSYQANASHIGLELTMTEATLEVDTAIPCGLIVNELVSNSLKHAFPNNQSGTIHISLQPDDDMQFTLQVTDNGIGFSPAPELASINSLGLQLINLTW